MFKRPWISKPKRTPPRLYDQLHTALVIPYGRKPWAIFGLVVGLSTAALSGLLSRNAGLHWIHTILLAFYEGSTGVLVVIGAKFLLDVTGMSMGEEKLITAGLSFLAQSQPDEDALETVKERATMGATAGQIKAIMPVLIFSTMSSAISRLITDSFAAADPLGYRTVGVTIIALFGLSFVLALDTANHDAAIVSIIAEYRGEQRRQARATVLPVVAAVTPPPTANIQSNNGKSVPAAKLKVQARVSTNRKAAAPVQSQPRKRRK